MNDTRYLRQIEASDISRARISPLDEATVETARAMLHRIDNEGDRAVLSMAEAFGDLKPGSPAVLGPEAMAAACERIPGDQLAMLERVCDRIRGFANAQRACLRDLRWAVPGGHAGHTCVPIATAGCYAPGGRFPLPSSVLMTAVTARAAGVEQVVVASPRPTDVTLAAAAIAGADCLLAIGGVQAIGAMTRGLCGVPRCDKIVGPGNRWVTAAKHLVSGEVGIDMLAGPSELLIIADATADPAVVAADLLAQAEHDEDAVPMLIALDRVVVDRVEREIGLQLATLATSGIARESLRNGFTVVARDGAEALELSDVIGPEHLEILTADAVGLGSRVKNAGAIFIGSGSAEVLGDYGLGPNHVLPTGGTSRFRAGLSVMDFLRVRTWIEMEGGGDRGALSDCAALARLESLEAHARAAEIRLR